MAFIDGQAVRFEDLPFPSASELVTVFPGIKTTRFEYADGYKDGERRGFISPREKTMEPVAPGEVDADKRTFDFHLYTTDGLPASGISGEGAVCTPAGSQIQINRDLSGYVNATGIFTHISDGKYRYTLSLAEIAIPGGEGNIWLRIKVPGFRTATFRVPLRVAAPSEVEIRDAVLSAARAGHITTGTIGEGVAVAVSLLHGNFYMDQVANIADDQTASRIRCFHTGAAASAASPGGSSEGEFATFIVITTYTGPSRIATHRVVQQ